MGSWGPGFLENDSSLDYIGNLIDRIVSDLNSDLKTLNDEGLERNAGACVSLLATLIESYSTASSVTIEQVEAWRAEVSSWLAAVISSETDDRDEWLAYKDSFDSEFERLANVIQQSK